MRITIVVPHLSGGGAELVACKWAEGLAELRHDVTLLLTHGTPTGHHLKGVHVQALAASTVLGRILALRKFLEKTGCEFVVGVMPYCNLLAVIASFGLRCRTAVSEHALHSSAIKTMSTSAQLQWQIAKRLYRKADVCFAVSHALASELSAACRVPPGRLWVIPNPVLEQSKGENTRRLTSKVQAPTLRIVSPSRLVAIKRLSIVIETGEILSKQGYTVELHFYGEGPDKDRLEGMASASGLKAEFHGRVDKWWLKAPESSIVVLTSGLEGFGNVLVEAAAHGFPSVVSSKALGVSDACIPGVTAQLLSGDSADDFATGVTKALAMAPLLSSSVAKHWLTRFTIQEVAVVMQQVLTSAMPTDTRRTPKEEPQGTPTTIRN